MFAPRLTAASSARDSGRGRPDIVPLRRERLHRRESFGEELGLVGGLLRHPSRAVFACSWHAGSRIGASNPGSDDLRCACWPSGLSFVIALQVLRSSCGGVTRVIPLTAHGSHHTVPGRGRFPPSSPTGSLSRCYFGSATACVKTPRISWWKTDEQGASVAVEPSPPRNCFSRVSCRPSVIPGCSRSMSLRGDGRNVRTLLCELTRRSVGDPRSHEQETNRPMSAAWSTMM